MTYSIDQEFIKKFTLLIQEVLNDEATFYFRKDPKFQKVHNYLFSKNVETPFSNIPEADKLDFRKYFYYGETAGQPRPDVPFADSPKDQAVFFDRFRQQIKNCTYNFSQLNLLFSDFADQNATAPTYSGYQNNLILQGLVYPLVHGMEQQQISEIESKTPGNEQSEEQKRAGIGNPYQGLGEKILVKGLSGQFDTILSYNQLADIAAEEAMLSAQGLSRDQVVALLKEYIKGRFPELPIYLTEDGKIIPFVRGAGISASGVQVEGGAVTSAVLLTEMTGRLGRELQYKAIRAGDGTLALSPLTYEVLESTGVKTQVNGLLSQVDQGGQGNNVVFFVADKKGVGAKVVVSTDEYRTGEFTNFHFSLYSDPQNDQPSNARIRLESPELNRLKTDLLDLYRQLQEIADFRTVPGRPVRDFLPGTVKPPEQPGQGKAGELGTSIPASATEGEIATAGQQAPVLPAARGRVAPPRINPYRVARPKIRAPGSTVGAAEPPVLETSKPPELPGRATRPATPDPTTIEPHRPPQPKKSADQSTAPDTARTAPPNPIRKRVALVAIATGLPIAASIGSALIKILI